MAIQLSGRWYNQHGSELQVQVDNEGRIDGSFRSGVGFPEAEEAFPVAGFAQGDLFGSTVSFGKYDSVTSWTGHCGIEGGEEVLSSLWHMSVGLVPGGAGEGQLWKGVWAGADVFRRGRSEPRSSRIAPSHPTIAPRAD
jgi:Avidin family